MKKYLLAASAAALLIGSASSANAAITMLIAIEDDLMGTTLGTYGQVMLENFDDVSNANTDYVGNVVTETPDPITNSAPPPWSGGVVVGGSDGAPVDPTDYASVQGASTGTFSTLNGYYLTSFSFYIGSPDEYNTVTFNLLGGGSQTFEGNAIWGGPVFGGDRTKGFRVYYDFGGAKVTSIEFASDQDAFEFDGLAGTLAVPEPSTWAMMIMGFGAAGALLRRRRQMTFA
jgi:hypothetical protein